MVSSIQRLGFSASATIEYRKLAVELAEVIIKWELQRIKDESDANEVSCLNIIYLSNFTLKTNQEIKNFVGWG